MIRNPIEIKEFILEKVGKNASDLATAVADKFGFSRQRAHIYINREVKKGTVIKIGNTKKTRYFLASGTHIEFALKIKPDLADDLVWSKYIKPMLLNYSDNIKSICAYGSTEIINNAIDHSEGSTMYVNVDIDDKNITLTIMDNGVGIFRKIQNALNLTSMRESLLQLSKGKFTTDPSKHTGEGIFFTSRIFDKFSILSDDMYYTFTGDEWFLSSEKQEDFGKGTYINMVLALDSTRTVKEIMDKYADQEIGFGKTIVAVALSADPNDPHVSRSQAKRLLMGLEKFRQIVLDFKGVPSVGQAFVDEVFRVFKNEHPEIKIEYLNTNEEVLSMIKRGLTADPS